ncbi:MAG: alkaline phosphatase family protein [Betaproteobacteria bacterium]|nr:alkaline phosphatase family protein [Betaproteobacteria bacterium]
MKALLWMFCWMAAVASAVELTAGPMAGAAFQRGTRLWLQADGPGTAQIEFWNTAKPADKRRSATVVLRAEEDFVAQFSIGGLEPGQTYGYRALLNGKAAKVAQSLTFRTQALWQWRTDPPDWKLAFGSCAYDNEAAYDRPGPVPYGGPPGTDRIFESMARQKPDMTLWGGDFTYLREADWDSDWGLGYRWRYAKARPTLQNLLRTGNHYAIWDDHEYGPNDSNGSYGLKGESLAHFKRHFPNPSFGLPETPGTFTNFMYNEVEFFLTDGRYYRDHDQLQSADKSMLGAAQVRWLKNALLASSARLKVVVAGSQVTNPSPWWIDGWDKYEKENADFLKFLADHRVDGVLFLTGDRHFTALYKNDRPGTYPLYELTCSPLTSGVGGGLDRERAKPNLVPGTLVGARNFCTLEFSGKRDARKVVIRSLDADGKELWRQDLNAADLRGPKRDD